MSKYRVEVEVRTVYTLEIEDESSQEGAEIEAHEVVTRSMRAHHEAPLQLPQGVALVDVMSDIAVLGTPPAGEHEIPVGYVAGKFRGADAYEIHRNVVRAEEANARLWKVGAAGLCPHMNTANFHGFLPDQVFLDGTLELVRRSDFIYLTPEWAESSGARGEAALMKAMDGPVFEFDELAKVAAFVEKWKATRQRTK